ncbi:MAG: hypothetical protein BWY27_01378 [Bacteroidetes bacterium ADurb.Bin234]|nr:MAG: hypothetical protein BWY27_01378 [Bacteroidetes bacterium ADurb.Bin234]
MQKKSPIKENILYFADSLNISRREFYRKINVSRGTLESASGITEEILSKFIATFPEINLQWLILGKGEMYQDNKLNINPLYSKTQIEQKTCEKCEEKERIISSQQQTIETQQQLIRFLQEQIRENRNQYIEKIKTETL